MIMEGHERSCKAVQGHIHFIQPPHGLVIFLFLNGLQHCKHFSVAIFKCFGVIFNKLEGTGACSSLLLAPAEGRA